MNSFPEFYEHNKPQRLAGWIMLILTALFLGISNQIVLLLDLPNWYDQQRFLSLLVLATGLLFYGLRPLYPPSPWAMGLIIGAIVLSLLSPLPGWALAESALFMGLVILAAWISSAVRTLHILRPNLILYSLIIYATLLCLPPLMQYLLALSSQQEFHLASLFRGFSNHRFFSQVESVLIPLIALPAMVLPENSRWRRLGNVAACLLWLLAFAAGTRAFYVTILFSVAFALLTCGQAGKIWCRWQSRFALIGWLGFVLLFMLIPELFGLTINSDNARLNTLEGGINSSGRLEMWIAALKLILEHPLTGIGPMHFATLNQSAVTQGFAAHPHNAVIQLLTEWGLPFGGLLIALLCTGFVQFQRQSRERTASIPDSTLRSTLRITLLTAVVYSLFDGSIVTPYSQVLLAMIIGLAWAQLRPQSVLNNKKNSTSKRIIIALIQCTTLATGTYLGWLAFSPFHQLMPHVAKYAKTYPDRGFYPRFWSQGLINLPEDQRYPTRYFTNTPRNVHGD